MAITNAMLAEIFKGWEVYQGHLVTAITPLTDQQLARSIAPNLRTVGIIAQHLIAVRVRWFHDAAGASPNNTALDTIAAWDRDGSPARTAAELVAGLNTSWQLIKDALSTWTPAELETPFERSRGGQTSTLTRQWIVWHVLEHDVHHGGEISLSLGAQGLTGLDV